MDTRPANVIPGKCCQLQGAIMNNVILLTLFATEVRVPRIDQLEAETSR